MAVGMTKFSILALIWRIFSIRSSRMVIAGISAFSVIWLVAVCLTEVFTCYPVESLWNFSVKPQRCIDPSKFWFATAAPNVVLDLLLLLLPNFWIMSLKVSKSRKIGLVVVFTLGIFVTICSALRLWQLVIYFHSGLDDQPWDTVPVGIWSVVEANTSVVCCCLPSMRPLLRLIMSKRATIDHTSKKESIVPCCNPHPTWKMAESKRHLVDKPYVKPIQLPKTTVPAKVAPEKPSLSSLVATNGSSTGGAIVMTGPTADVANVPLVSYAPTFRRLFPSRRRSADIERQDSERGHSAEMP